MTGPRVVPRETYLGRDRGAAATGVVSSAIDRHLDVIDQQPAIGRVTRLARGRRQSGRLVSRGEHDDPPAGPYQRPSQGEPVAGGEGGSRAGGIEPTSELHGHRPLD